VAQAVGTAALAAGVKLVTGDTKVVDSGHGDGVFINTAGSASSTSAPTSASARNTG